MVYSEVGVATLHLVAYFQSWNPLIRNPKSATGREGSECVGKFVIVVGDIEGCYGYCASIVYGWLMVIYQL